MVERSRNTCHIFRGELEQSSILISITQFKAVAGATALQSASREMKTRATYPTDDRMHS
jgi:hypothetical protein